MTLTIRQLMDEQRELHHTYNPEDSIQFCRECDKRWPCPDYERAVEALAILDEAEVEEYGLSPRYRLVSDPAPPTENT